MKKILSVIILCALLIGVVTSFSSCGAMTMDDVKERLHLLEIEDKLNFRDKGELCDPEGWTEEINEEFKYNDTGYELDGEVLTVFYIKEYETFVFEFESVSDAKKAKSALSGWENEHRYVVWDIVQIDKIVMFGEKSIINMILE